MLSHHAHLCRVNNVSLDSAKLYIGSLGINETYNFTLDKFGIGDVKTLTDKAFIKPAIAKQQLLVVSFNSITVEAQQALLKILEEPPSSTVFVFCVPSGLFLLPTLLSRFHQPGDLFLETVDSLNDTFVLFTALSIKDRLSEITTRLAAKDTDWIQQIKSGLLTSLVKKEANLSAAKLTWLFWLAEHLQTRGASNKMLLEELALTIE